VRPLMTVLREGSVLLLVGDGWHSASFVDVEFLGRRLPFTSGPLNLARLADAPVVPLFSVGEPHRMRFEFEPAFKVDRSGVQAADVARAVTFFIGRVEQRMLADVPNWQHWLVEDVFGTLEGWRERPIQERYAV
jgi:lauroyl/myristoyl acyltransferase